eukprot:UN01767
MSLGVCSGIHAAKKKKYMYSNDIENKGNQQQKTINQKKSMLFLPTFSHFTAPTSNVRVFPKIQNIMSTFT